MHKIQQMFDITDQVAIITGASSGIGVTLAKGLAEVGAKVVLAARRVDRLNDLVAEIEAGGKEALAVKCDIADPDNVDNLVAQTLEKFGRLDILVNNAGVAKAAPMENETLEDYRTVFDVNVTGAFLCSQRCGRVMLEAGKGCIVNIASMAAFIALDKIPQASYHAAKGAVVSLTREMGAQWALRGVRVNTIAPGWFHTEMTEELFNSPNGHKYIKRQTPMGRAGKPEELLGPLLLLASDASSFMTGQTIVVDGGWTII